MFSFMSLCHTGKVYLPRDGINGHGECKFNFTKWRQTAFTNTHSTRKCIKLLFGLLSGTQHLLLSASSILASLPGIERYLWFPFSFLLSTVKLVCFHIVSGHLYFLFCEIFIPAFACFQIREFVFFLLIFRGSLYSLSIMCCKVPSLSS